jgi:hypothetical protein
MNFGTLSLFFTDGRAMRLADVAIEHDPPVLIITDKYEKRLAYPLHNIRDWKFQPALHNATRSFYRLNS